MAVWNGKMNEVIAGYEREKKEENSGVVDIEQKFEGKLSALKDQIKVKQKDETKKLF